MATTTKVRVAHLMIPEGHGEVTQNRFRPACDTAKVTPLVLIPKAERNVEAHATLPDGWEHCPDCKAIIDAADAAGITL